MANLSSRSKSVRCVINYPFRNDLAKVSETFSALGYSFAMIIHDKDTDENGELKTKHIHLLLLSPKRHQLQYYLFRLCEIFDCFPVNVSVLVSESVTNDLQYLIHKNDITKYQYDKKDIIHNFNTDYLHGELETQNDGTLNAKQLIAIIKQSRSRLEVMDRIGLSRYVLYRNAIKDISEDLNK